MPRRGEALCIMNYYVDIHANLLPGLAGLGGGKLTGSEAEARLAVFQESNIKLAVAAPYYDPEQSYEGHAALRRSGTYWNTDVFPASFRWK